MHIIKHFPVIKEVTVNCGCGKSVDGILNKGLVNVGGVIKCINITSSELLEERFNYRSLIVTRRG